MTPSDECRATAEDVQREASRYVLHTLGDQMWAGVPVFNERQQRWSVPIHSRSLPEEVSVGEIEVDLQGSVRRGPSRDMARRAVRKCQKRPLAPTSHDSSDELLVSPDPKLD
jgi:hypothetical protein